MGRKELAREEARRGRRTEEGRGRTEGEKERRDGRRGIEKGSERGRAGRKGKGKSGEQKSNTPYLTSDPSPHIHHLHDMGDDIRFHEVVEGPPGCTLDSLDHLFCANSISKQKGKDDGVVEVVKGAKGEHMRKGTHSTRYMLFMENSMSKTCS